MSIIQKLIDSSVADTDVLRVLDTRGDNFKTFRDVDFTFRCKDYDKSKLVTGFINEYQFGHAIADQESGENRLIVTINMPIEQYIILSISGFMTCIAELYDIEYEGWGCVAKSS